jgi:FixJ family two-component response regulator
LSASTDLARPVVVVIDDDADVREALGGLFRSVGLNVDPFGSVAAFQEAARPDRPGCMVLDVRLPGKSGLEFQEELVRASVRSPIVFISGHADVAMCARAMKAGAVEFLTKPVRDQDLLDAVQAAIERDAQTRMVDAHRARRRADMARLSAREQEVMLQVVAGRRNKQIAGDIGVSEGTVKLHRAQIMRKLNVQTLAELVRIADALGEEGNASDQRPRA